MRANLYRAAILVATAVALTLGVATVTAAPAAADTVCQAGSNWDGVIKACR
jgi:ABC-type proline/glycine betaine transport system substrate-binding protein